jgi:hypothetical protein
MSDDFEVPSTPTECLYCGHFAWTREERKHYCPVVAAVNGANTAIAIGFVVCCVLLGFLASGLCGVHIQP